MSARALASSGVLLSLVGLHASPVDTPTSRSLREATSLVFYALLFLLFLLSSLSYVLFFSWACDELYSGTMALLCSASSYVLIVPGFLSPVLWRRGKKFSALIVLLFAFLFLGFVVRVLSFSALVWLLTAVLFAMELSTRFGGDKSVL